MRHGAEHGYETMAGQGTAVRKGKGEGEAGDETRRADYRMLYVCMPSMSI